ncbi:hypothetical protein GGF50DRAFT_109590 [Schizophyllum commune]
MRPGSRAIRTGHRRSRARLVSLNSLLHPTSTTEIMGGGGQYPYPKYVWSPTGGWWGRPAAWKANTAVLGVAMLGAAYLVGLAGEARAERPFIDAQREINKRAQAIKQKAEAEAQAAS